MNHFSFPDIEQLRSVVKLVRERCDYHGIPLPKLDFVGTVKLHGTNAGVVLDLTTGEISVQSRERIIKVGDDNAGFAAFVEANLDAFKLLFERFKPLTANEPSHLAIYGEWCGQGIMKGVAVSQLPKMFVIFGVKQIYHGLNEGYVWVDHTYVRSAFIHAPLDEPTKAKLKCIFDFKLFYTTIDFADLVPTQVYLDEVTKAVELECPVAKQLGLSGVGEGVVWSIFRGPHTDEHTILRTDDLIFKTKGDKHREVHTKERVEVDLEKLASIDEFVKAVVTEHRLEKLIDKLKLDGVEVDIKNTGAFMKLVGNDILKEEEDRLLASGFEWKDVAKSVNAAAKQRWMQEASKL